MDRILPHDRVAKWGYNCDLVCMLFVVSMHFKLTFFLGHFLECYRVRLSFMSKEIFMHLEKSKIDIRGKFIVPSSVPCPTN